MASCLLMLRQRRWQLVLLLYTFSLFSTSTAQDCSATQLCATGCCSQFGFCGTDTAHCGTGCLSTCDFKLGCDASNPCAAGTGCCNSFGFCGLGPDYCDPKVCVADCDEKSYCDPGYSSSGYATVEKCPLNVCCSKFGFCGLTEEFCGNKTVTHETCSSSGPTTRVVGYYEGWANRRVCEEFPPKMIPLGVYTHINFAFASINPTTFAVVPGDAADVALYSQITLLKKKQPDLKVFIAIGGWTFNDPGPTATTFSDIAGSIANQAKFFASLTSFMSTYNFDGVDIDWEYPAADDRSGRTDDFANYPTFLANLKSHLTSTGGRNGLSITIPASYWYLQHFDIVNIEKSIDFFNIMTYDLHGLWDKGNKWLGNFLNAHTNLTEITDSMDLLWRNKINPSKVNLGLAFYARTFTMSDPNCSKPGCLFSSAGNAGLCTDSVGTLSNAEIADRILQNDLTPIHYEDAAVKVITWDDQWVAYDDADTYQQKADFARSQCLGGVMVWALSQDSSDLASSQALATATGSESYASFVVRTTGDAPEATTTSVTTMKNRQCRWSDCGSGCDSVGDNFVPIPRGYGSDNSNGADGELMQDSTNCGSKGVLRFYCCPVESELPVCAHFYFNNGKCNGDNTNTCETTGVYKEIGSINQFCNNAKKGGYEQLCCTSPAAQGPAMALYNQCTWNGQPGKCDTKLTTPVVSNTNGCPANTYSSLIAASASGSGGMYCGEQSNGLGDDGFHFQHRDYCCASSDTKRWNNCYSTANIGYIPPGRDVNKWCQSGCPVGRVRVAMDNALSCFENGGAEVWCCDEGYTYEVTTTTVNAQLLAYQDAAKEFASLSTEECLVYDFLGGTSGTYLGGGGLKKRSMNYTEERSTSALQPRQFGNIGIGTVSALISLIYDLLTNILNGNSLLTAEAVTWDGLMEQLGYAYLSVKLLKNFLDNDLQYSLMSYSDVADGLPCNLPTWNSAVSLGPSNGTSSSKNACSQWTIVSLDSDFFSDDQDYIDSEGSATTRRSSPSLAIEDFLDEEEIYSLLERRDGGTRDFTVNFGLDANGNPRIIIVVSWVYPSGGNGQALVDATGVNVRYSLSDDTNCVLATYSETADPEAVPAWVVEHIFELQTVARLLEFIVTQVFPAVTTGGVTVPQYTASSPPVPVVAFTDWFQEPYENWPINAGNLAGRPDQRLMYQLGAKGNANHLVLMDAVGNSFKAKGWALKAPIADTTWVSNGYNVELPANGTAALSAIRGVLGTLSYLSNPTIDGHLHTVVQALHASLLEFQTQFNGATAYHGLWLNAMPIWNEGVEAWGSRMDYFIRNWVLNRITALRGVWANVLRTTTDQVLADFATEIIADLDSLRVQAEAAGANLASFRF